MTSRPWTGTVTVHLDHTIEWTVDETWDAADADAALLECNVELREALIDAYETQAIKETWRTRER